MLGYGIGTLLAMDELGPQASLGVLSWHKIHGHNDPIASERRRQIVSGTRAGARENVRDGMLPYWSRAFFFIITDRR